MRDRDMCAAHSGVVSLDPAKGAQASREARAARKAARIEAREMTLQDHVAQALANHAEEIVGAFLQAGLVSGDWRALEALITRHYGKPQERLEVSQGEDVDLRQLSDEELEALKRRLRRQLHAVTPALPQASQSA
jgi:hypothetical protein